MVPSLKYCHSKNSRWFSIPGWPTLFFPILLLLVLNGCTQKEEILYKKKFSEEEKSKLAESFFNGAGTDLYYQGTVGERMVINEGISFDTDNAWAQRELGVPYLKRGFGVEANYFYEKAVELDPKEWAGYKGYCWLYFYRDYETAIRDLDLCDSFTPNTVDYPQATSVDYMRGVAYLRLDSLDKAIYYLDKHLQKEIKDVEVDYVEPVAFLNLGIAYSEADELEKAEEIFLLGIENNEKNPELHYYLALLYKKQNKFLEARNSLNKASEWHTKGYGLVRPYVEEFHAIYKEDLARLNELLENI